MIFRNFQYFIDFYFLFDGNSSETYGKGILGGIPIHSGRVSARGDPFQTNFNICCNFLLKCARTKFSIKRTCSFLQGDPAAPFLFNAALDLPAKAFLKQAR